MVQFRLSGDASARFAQLTGANIDKPMAILLDDKVESAPMIQGKIRGSGQITMGSSATFENARDLSIVLKAGALPAPVEIIEKNVVGATLGADSIKKGFFSAGGYHHPPPRPPGGGHPASAQRRSQLAVAAAACIESRWRSA